VSSERVVIASGNGFLGQLLARSLATDGHDVDVLLRRPDGNLISNQIA
jgi:nucleoside-diphosphate-sugar epimerase